MGRIAKVSFWTIALVGFLCLIPLVSNTDAVAADSSPGQDVFMAAKCNMCHAVSTVGIEAKMKAAAMQGPDLKGVGQRVDAETLAKYMRKEAQIDGKDHKKEWKGSAEDLDTMLAWLNEQKGD